MNIGQIIRATDCPEVPWKNGGGTTREIAVFPPGAGIDDFLWRLSIAKIERSGPFSTFNGIDRTLIVIRGTLRLSSLGADATLDETSDPLTFDGNAQVQATILQEDVYAINVMVRRGSYACEAKRVMAGDYLEASDDTFLIHVDQQIKEGMGTEFSDAVRLYGGFTTKGGAVIVRFLSLTDQHG